MKRILFMQGLVLCGATAQAMEYEQQNGVLSDFVYQTARNQHQYSQSKQRACYRWITQPAALKACSKSINCTIISYFRQILLNNLPNSRRKKTIFP